MAGDCIGTVAAICRYPVKSMGGEALTSANLRWQGIDGDRQYAFYRAADASRFPWLTGREVADMVTYTARYLEIDNPRHSPVGVMIGERELRVGDPELRERLCKAAGEEVRLLQIGRGAFDAMPVSVLSTATVALIEARCGRPIDTQRFRANIVIEPLHGQTMRETEWTGRTLVFGEGPDMPKLRANVPIDRCVMITLDPVTAARDPAILRRVVEDFDNEIGVRCATETPGRLSLGDPVYLA